MIRTYSKLLIKIPNFLYFLLLSKQIKRLFQAIHDLNTNIADLQLQPLKPAFEQNDKEITIFLNLKNS